MASHFTDIGSKELMALLSCPNIKRHLLNRRRCIVLFRHNRNRWSAGLSQVQACQRGAWKAPDEISWYPTLVSLVSACQFIDDDT